MIAPPAIEKNLIFNNEAGIVVMIPDDIYNAPYDLQSLIIQNNTIIHNRIGVDLATATPLITFNNIYDNSHENKKRNVVSTLTEANAINATHNWWGTTDEQPIKNAVGAAIIFAPYLTEPNPNAPTNPDTTSPNSSSSPPFLPNPTQQPSPTVLEFPAGVILLLIAAALAIFALIKKKNQN